MSLATVLLSLNRSKLVVNGFTSEKKLSSENFASDCAKLFIAITLAVNFPENRKIN